MNESMKDIANEVKEQIINQQGGKTVLTPKQKSKNSTPRNTTPLTTKSVPEIIEEKLPKTKMKPPKV